MCVMTPRSELYRLAERRGWTVHKPRRGHPQLRHPSGAIVVASWTSSDRNHLRILEAYMRRAERRVEGTI
jgi:predicted RNA binding protein YcfA (HicA-like mRNA interferase family)